MSDNTHKAILLCDTITSTIERCEKAYNSLVNYQEDDLAELYLLKLADFGRGLLSYDRRLSGFEKIVTARVNEVSEDDEVSDYELRTYESLLHVYEQIAEGLEGERPSVPSVTSIKKIAVNGNSLSLAISKEAEALGVKRGDYVRITIERV